jgi:DegV family protein with EDD domain
VAVAVVTDTTHYLPPHIAARHSLRSVPLYVNWNGTTRPESDLGDLHAFYADLRAAEDLPTTSQPSVGDFLGAYRPLLDAGHDLVSIHLSAGISGTFAAAERARADLLEQGLDPARLVVVDSTTAAGGTGLMLIAAANAAADGADAAGSARAALDLRRELQMRFAVDTLEFLRRGGRIGMAQAWLGSALKIKPILTLESQVEPVERVRTWSRAFDRLLDHLDERRAEGHDAWFIQHVQAEERVAHMTERGSEIFGRGPEFVSELGPVIGTHVGPGVVGVAAIRRDLLSPV